MWHWKNIVLFVPFLKHFILEYWKKIHVTIWYIIKNLSTFINDWDIIKLDLTKKERQSKFKNSAT